MPALLLLLSELAWGTSLLHEPPVLVFGPVDAPPERVLQPLLVTEPMRDWLHQHVSPVGTEDERMMHLVAALSRDLPLTYTNGHTGTAEEVFESGAFNCLALAHLVVALGRELGVDAYYVRVGEFRSYHQRGPLILSSTHVAAGWGPASDVQLVELERVTDEEKRQADRISDLDAVGLHYTNRGAELLMTDQPDLAQEWLVRASEIAPSQPEAWVDRGVALRRLGDLDGAEAAYRRALDLDPSDLSAWRNLAALLDLRGRGDAAQELLALATRRSNDNPFTWLALGDLTARQGEVDAAARFYRHAARLDPGNPVVLAARAELALVNGDRDRAERLVARAICNGPSDPRVRSVAARLEAGVEPAR